MEFYVFFNEVRCYTLDLHSLGVHNYLLNMTEVFPDGL